MPERKGERRKNGRKECASAKQQTKQKFKQVELCYHRWIDSSGLLAARQWQMAMIFLLKSLST